MSQRTALELYAEGVACANEGRYDLAINAFRTAADGLSRLPPEQRGFLALWVERAARASIETLEQWTSDDPYDDSAASTSELGLILSAGEAGMWLDLATPKRDDALCSVAVLYRGIVSVARIRMSRNALVAADRVFADHDWTTTEALCPCLALDWSPAFTPLWCNTGWPLYQKIAPLPRWIPLHMRRQHREAFVYRFGVALLPRSEFNRVGVSYMRFYNDPSVLAWHDESRQVRIRSFREIARLIEEPNWQLSTRFGPNSGPTFRITSLVQVGCAPWSFLDRYRLKFAHMQALERKVELIYHGRD